MISGTVGTMLLHIPVAGGHKGGDIKLNDHGELKSFSTETGSKRRFHLWAFHNTCQQEVEPITAGAMAILVVRLIWTNPPIGALFRPIDFPAFIEALADVNRCFNRLSWNSPSDDSSDDSSDDLFSSETDDDPYHPDHRNEEGFFFFLENKYDKKKLKWSSLKGQDSHLALLFQACPSIEVHLTIVEQKFDEELQVEGDSDNDDEPFLSASNWIHPEIGPVHLSEMEGYPRGRLIHKELKMHDEPYEYYQPDKEEDDPDSNYTTSTYLIPALCIWPKKKSAVMYATYGFDALLDRMESSNADGGLTGLNELLNVVQRKRSEIWMDSETGGADRAERLLGLCFKMGAKDEGVRLLWLLAMGFPGQNGYIDFEGIRDDAVAEAIAEFECHVGGK